MKNNKLIYDEKIAEEYKAMYNDPLELGCDMYLADRLTEVIAYLKQSFPGETIRIADIGCGEGFIYNMLQKNNIRGVKYIGIDVSTAMLHQAVKSGVPEQLLVQGDMHDMSDFLRDESVHLVTAIHGTHSYTKSPIDVHKESARILIPKGKKITMKYTARLGSKVFTGESTAHHPDSEKFFYSGNLAKEAVEKSNYFFVNDFHGINFFALPIHIMERAKKENNHDLLQRGEKDKKTLLNMHKIIQHPVITDNDIPFEERIELLQSLLDTPVHVPPHEAKYRSDENETKDEIYAAYSYLKEEVKITKFLNYDPGAARYMYLEATRNDKPYRN